MTRCVDHSRNIVDASVRFNSGSHDATFGGPVGTQTVRTTCYNLYANVPIQATYICSFPFPRSRGGRLSSRCTRCRRCGRFHRVCRYVGECADANDGDGTCQSGAGQRSDGPRVALRPGWNARCRGNVLPCFSTGRPDPAGPASGLDRQRSSCRRVRDLSSEYGL
jgi:hypothetical protein